MGDSRARFDWNLPYVAPEGLRHAINWGAGPQREQLLGWGMRQRSRYMAVASAIYVPGFLSVAPLLRSLGTRRTMVLGVTR